MKPTTSTPKSMKLFLNPLIFNIMSHRLEQLLTSSTATYAVIGNTVASFVVFEGQMFTASLLISLCDELSGKTDIASQNQLAREESPAMWKLGPCSTSY